MIPNVVSHDLANAESTAASHWLAGLDGVSARRPVDLPARVEVAVLGGGLMGISVTYWLAKRGISTLLLEERSLASGATGRNAGIMLAGTSPLEDRALVARVLDEEAIQADYFQAGHLALAQSEATWEAFHREVRQRSPEAGPLYTLDRAECEALLRRRIAPAFRGGRWDPRGGLIDPVRFAVGLATAAHRYEAVLAIGTPALMVQPCASGGYWAVETPRGEIAAREIVFACNSRVSAFAPALAGVVTPMRGQVLSTEPLPALFSLGLAVDWGTLYWRQAQEGAIVLGGYRNIDPVNEVGEDESVHPGIQGRLEGFFAEAFPGFPPFRVARRWAGIMDVTSDGRPLIGKLPNAAHQWIISGFGGHGMPVGLGAGRALAESIAMGREQPTLAPYAPSRFSVASDQMG